MCIVLVLCGLICMPVGASAALIKSVPESSVSSYNESNPAGLRRSNLYAQSAILIDADTGRVLFSKEHSLRLYPASMTKLMTALLVVENLDMDTELTASKKAAAIGDSKIYCEEGEVITVRDALYGLLMTSSNPYAGMLAEGVAGSMDDFAVMMTNRAKELGCTDTNFANPHGLTDQNHYTTVQDMAKIMQAAVREPEILQVISTCNYTLSANNVHEKPRSITNSNKMLPDSGDVFAYQYMVGGKTGYTDAAKHTFAGYAEKDGMRLISVVMGTTQDGKWLDTKKLMEYGFAAYSRVSLADLYALSPKTTTVRGAAASDNGVLQLELPKELDPTTSYLLVSTAERDDIAANFSQYCTVQIDGNLVAPVQQGKQVGTLSFQYGQMTPVSFPLLAARTIATEVVSVTPPPTQRSGVITGTGLFVSTESGEKRFSPLLLLVIVPAGLFLVLIIWLLVEIKRLKKDRRLRRQKQREEAIRQRYEESKRNRVPFESSVRIEAREGGADARREPPSAQRSNQHAPRRRAATASQRRPNYGRR